MRKLFITGFLIVAAALPAAAQVGAPADPGFSYYGPFGPSSSFGTPMFAQTFQRPAAGFDWLQSFTVYLGDWNGDESGTNLIFQAALYAVNGARLGSRLYLSDPQTGSANYFTFDAYTFATPNLYLDPMVGTYALVLQSVSTTNDALNVIAAGSPDYPSGAFFTVDEDGNLTAVNEGSDAAFEATLTDAAVPEPASLILFVTGLSFVGMVARQRRSA